VTELPHKRYLLYQLSKGISKLDLLQTCRRLYLVPPSDEYLADLRHELGTVPKFWESAWTRGNIQFRRWLRDRCIESFWRNSDQAVEAERLCMVSEMRQDAQALLLLHGPEFELITGVLRLKYPANTVPSRAGLEQFSDAFWDVASLTSTGLWDFLRIRDDQDKLIAAATGDRATTYGLIGVQEEVTSARFRDNVIAYANSQVELARRQPEGASGNRMAGLAALIRQAADQLERKEELSQVEDDSIVEEAQRFAMRRVRAEKPIISIDDLPSLEDADEDDVEEVDNVRKLRV